MNGTTTDFQGSPATVSDLNWEIKGVGDFNGDGSSNILWRNSSTGEVYIWLMNGLNVASQGSLGKVDQNWQIKRTGDFDGDGKADILWRNAITGQLLYLVHEWTDQHCPGFTGDSS